MISWFSMKGNEKRKRKFVWAWLLYISMLDVDTNKQMNIGNNKHITHLSTCMSFRATHTGYLIIPCTHNMEKVQKYRIQETIFSKNPEIQIIIYIIFAPPFFQNVSNIQLLLHCLLPFIPVLIYSFSIQFVIWNISSMST